MKENKMIYHWTNVQKALDLVRAFPWETKLKKIEYFSDACSINELFVSINEIVGHPFTVDETIAEDYKTRCFNCTAWTLAELKASRRDCERHVKQELNDLSRGCRSGEYECIFDLEG